MEPDYFERLYAVEERHWWHASRRDLVADQIRIRYPEYSGLRVLDVGCGTGRMLAELRCFGSAYGIDLADEPLSFCRDRGVADVMKASVLELPFEGGCCDIITALDVLEHIEDDRAALRECLRVLRPGGRLFAFVPAYQWLWSLQDDVSHHFRRYTRTTLRSPVVSAGFDIERLTYINMFLLPVIASGRLWLRVLLRFRHIEDENRLHPNWANGLLRSIFMSEAALLRRWDLPMGASILCIAKRPETSIGFGEDTAIASALDR
jgi:SAM-dependent methyltransferase